MEPHPKHLKAQNTAPNRCRRCPGTVVVRLKKTRRSDNDIYRCTRCGLIFSPGQRLSEKGVLAEDPAQGGRQLHNQETR